MDFSPFTTPELRQALGTLTYGRALIDEGRLCQGACVRERTFGEAPQFCSVGMLYHDHFGRDFENWREQRGTLGELFHEHTKHTPAFKALFEVATQMLWETLRRNVGLGAIVCLNDDYPALVPEMWEQAARLVEKEIESRVSCADREAELAAA